MTFKHVVVVFAIVEFLVILVVVAYALTK